MVRWVSPEFETPPKVLIASRLLWLLAGLAALRTALVLLGDDADDSVTTVLVGLVLVGGLLSICAYLVPRGIGWARGLGTVIASLAAIGGLSSVLDARSVAFAVLGAVGAAAAVGAVVLMFSAEARPFFRTPGRRPTAR